jgi:hypothetical protein
MAALQKSGPAIDPRADPAVQQNVSLQHPVAGGENDRSGTLWPPDNVVALRQHALTKSND